MPHDARPRSLLECWLLSRNRRLSDPAFQRWVARFPLAHGTARGQARGAFDLVGGLVYSQVLFACAELDLFALLGGEPMEVGDIAAATGLDAPAAERLLKAAVSLGLVSRVGARFTLGQRGAVMLGNPGVLAMVRHHGLLYADLADPVGLLRGRRRALADYWPFSGAQKPGDVAGVDACSKLMAASQPMIAAQVLGTYNFTRARRLMDVGGGAGAFLIAVGAHYPGLALMAFDPPAVIGVTHARFAAAGLWRAGAHARR